MVGYHELSLSERVSIQLGHERGEGVRAISARLGRSASTISRELNRGTMRGVYCATRAQADATCLRRKARLVPDYWEGDLLKEAGNRCAVAVAVERMSGFVVRARLSDTGAKATLAEFDPALPPIPPGLRRTLAYDQGREMSAHLSAAETAAERLADAAECIMVGDRESDIYALFSRRPASVHLLVRAGQNRALENGTQLFEASTGWPALGRQMVDVAPRGPGDRQAQVTLRAGTVTVRHPRNGRCEGDAPSIAITLVEAIEEHPPAGQTGCTGGC